MTKLASEPQRELISSEAKTIPGESTVHYCLRIQRATERINKRIELAQSRGLVPSEASRRSIERAADFLLRILSRFPGDVVDTEKEALRLHAKRLVDHAERIRDDLARGRWTPNEWSQAVVAEHMEEAELQERLSEILGFFEVSARECTWRAEHARRSVTDQPMDWDDANYLLLHCEELVSAVNEYHGWRCSVALETSSAAGEEMLVQMVRWWSWLQIQFEFMGLHPVHYQPSHPRSERSVAVMAALEALFAEQMFPIVHWYVRERFRASYPDVDDWLDQMTSATSRLRAALESEQETAIQPNGQVASVPAGEPDSTVDPATLDVTIWDQEWLEVKGEGQSIKKVQRTDFASQSDASWTRLIEFAHADGNRLAPPPKARDGLRVWRADFEKRHGHPPAPREFEEQKRKLKNSRDTWLVRNRRLAKSLMNLLRLSRSPIQSEGDGSRTMIFRSLKTQFGHDPRAKDTSAAVREA